MGRIYNIDLSDNFLKRVVCFINRNIEPAEFAKYTVVLPNKRCCREFRKYFCAFNEGKIICLPKIISISDTIIFDDHKITMRIMQVLRKHNTNIPINTIFELSASVAKLIKELVINDIDYSKIRDLVPASLVNYWEHTTNIIYECVNDPEISNILTTCMIGLQHFTVSKNNQRTIAAGICNADYYTKRFLKSVFASENGIIFTTGRDHSQNQAYNTEILGNLPYTNLPINSKTISIELAEFQNISEEAQAVAMAVRQAILERKIVLIVAPNINLAARIKSELLYWNIIADDSYGDAFSETTHGLLISLIIDAISDRFSVSSMLRILKMTNSLLVALNIELFLKQQKKIYPNFFDAFTEWTSRSSDSDAQMLDIVAKLNNILQNNGLLDENVTIIRKSFPNWSRAVQDIAHILNAESAVEFSNVTKKYNDCSECFGQITFAEYSLFLRKHCQKASVRHVHGYTDGVVILGTIEAQLLDADFVVIAGANEDDFTTSEHENFWMSDSMMQALNIPSSETKNRFLQCIFERLSYKTNVLITRSEKIAGIQQVKYPFLNQISKVLEVKQNTYFSDFMRQRVVRHNLAKISLPFPNPQLQYRPNRLSVSDIELLKDNAYSFYGEKILKLNELNEIDEIRNLRGNYIHLVLDNFVKKRYGNDIYYTAEKTLEEFKIGPRLFGLWFFRINNILQFVAKNTCDNSVSEIWGEALLEISQNYTCKIICKADRIDINDDGSATIIDYKTASKVVSQKDVERGDKIQLLIEAWIANSGGFKFPRLVSVSSAQYWFLKKECEKVVITNDTDKTNTLVEKIMDKLKTLIYQYNIAGRPYGVNLNYEFSKSYMHLARVKEWLDA